MTVFTIQYKSLSSHRHPSDRGGSGFGWRKNGVCNRRNGLDESVPTRANEKVRYGVLLRQRHENGDTAYTRTSLPFQAAHRYVSLVTLKTSNIRSYHRWLMLSVDITTRTLWPSRRLDLWPRCRMINAKNNCTPLPSHTNTPTLWLVVC